MRPARRASTRQAQPPAQHPPLPSGPQRPPSLSALLHPSGTRRLWCWCRCLNLAATRTAPRLYAVVGDGVVLAVVATSYTCLRRLCMCASVVCARWSCVEAKDCAAYLCVYAVAEPWMACVWSKRLWLETVWATQCGVRLHLCTSSDLTVSCVWCAEDGCVHVCADNQRGKSTMKRRQIGWVRLMPHCPLWCRLWSKHAGASSLCLFVVVSLNCAAAMRFAHAA